MPIYGRAVCPANEGIETWPPGGISDEIEVRAARSAPLMRGLKPMVRNVFSCGCHDGRAVCPANEGIETQRFATRGAEIGIGRAVCPANEGIETLAGEQSFLA